MYLKIRFDDCWLIEIENILTVLLGWQGMCFFNDS